MYVSLAILYASLQLYFGMVCFAACAVLWILMRK